MEEVALKNAAHKRSRVAAERVVLEGWDKVPPTQEWTFLRHSDRVYYDTVLNLRRHATPLVVFQALMPPELIQTIANDGTTYEEALLVFGIEALVMSRRFEAERFMVGRPNREQSFIIKLMQELIEMDLPHVGCKLFKRLQKSLTMSPSIIQHEVSRTWSNLVATWSETVALDEKLRKWRGAAPHYMHVPGKPEPKGQWTSQLVTMLEDTDLPFCVGMYPFAAAKYMGEEQLVQDVWLWVSELLPSPNPPIVVADRYYGTRAAVQFLTGQSIPFLISARPDWYKDVSVGMEKECNDVGKTSVRYNEGLQLAAVMHWDRDKNIGKKLVLSTAFRPSTSRTAVDGVHIIYSVYGSRFNSCDQFNRLLYNFSYPFRASNYEVHFHRLAMSSLWINCYHAWIYSNPMMRQYPNIDEFLRTMAFDILRSLKTT